MSDWICAKCNVGMEQAEDIGITYNEVDLPPALGCRCPSCGTEFLDGQFVLNELVPAEEMLEGK